MSGKETQGLVIIDNLEQFTAKLLDVVADDSLNGAARLIKLARAGLAEYKKPRDYLITGFLYSRSRVEEIEQFITWLETVKNNEQRLAGIQQRITTGGWHKDSSFNYYFFRELIKAIPGYEPLDDKGEEVIIHRLSTLFPDYLQGFIKQYQDTQKAIEATQKELAAVQNAPKKSVDHILVTNDLKNAEHLAKKQAANTVFHLILKNKLWVLSWFDSSGKAHGLPCSAELKSLLASQNITDIAELRSTQVVKLKNECMKIRNAFLDKIQVLINPNDATKAKPLSNEQLSEMGIRAHFILRRANADCSLSWIDTLGRAKSITLAEYPLLLEWLSKADSNGEQYATQLKTFLLQVKVNKSLQMDGFKEQLQNCLFPVAETPSKKPQIETGKLKIGDYAIASIFGHKPKEGKTDKVPAAEVVGGALQ